MLEAGLHEANAFVTLTYSDDKLPENGTLVPKDAQGWLKRLRARVAPSTFRFYLVGEYGDVSERPHYHAALFGYKSCAYGQSSYTARRVDCCYWCDLVRDTWGHGHVYLGSVEADSARYLAGYVVKKMVSQSDPRLRGRYPEFARMSLRPGIGRDAMFEVADVLMKYGIDSSIKDVPDSLMHGLKKLPLGRYLRQNLRRMIGRDEKISQAAWSEMEKEVLSLRLVARNDKEDPSFKSHLMKAKAGELARFEARQRIFGKQEKKL